jgi:hypothetical protein
MSVAETVKICGCMCMRVCVCVCVERERERDGGWEWSVFHVIGVRSFVFVCLFVFVRECLYWCVCVATSV